MLAKFSTITGLASFIAASLVSHLTQTRSKARSARLKFVRDVKSPAFIEFTFANTFLNPLPMCLFLIEVENKLNIASIST
jgi:hypothetical protein